MHNPCTIQDLIYAETRLSGVVSTVSRLSQCVQVEDVSCLNRLIFAGAHLVCEQLGVKPTTETQKIPKENG